jgi:hypothetical protein
MLAAPLIVSSCRLQSFCAPAWTVDKTLRKLLTAPALAFVGQMTVLVINGRIRRADWRRAQARNLAKISQ